LKRLLLDVNVVLDVLLRRPPFAEAARALWAAAERQEIEALVPAHGATTIFYVAARERDARSARKLMHDLLAVLGVAPVDGRVLHRALALSWSDYEDAICAAAAEAASCEAIVSRDPKDFRDSPVPVVDPVTALGLLSRGGGPDRVAEAPIPRASPSRSRRRHRE